MTPQSRLMQPTGAAPSSQPPSDALFQPADLFDMSLPISKMARMAMSTDNATRAALRSQIVTRTQQQELLGIFRNSLLSSDLLYDIDQTSRGVAKMHILYFTGWTSPNIHFKRPSGRWTTPPGVQCDAFGADGVFHAVVPSHAFVFTDGKGCWDHVPGGCNYVLRESGLYFVIDGAVLRPVDLRQRQHLLPLVNRGVDAALKKAPSLRQQELLGHTPTTVTSTLLNGVQQHIDRAIRRLGLEDVLAFDIDGDVEGGLRFVWLLEQGSGEEWRSLGRFLRLAFIYRLTPANTTRPLWLSANSLPTATAFHQLPIAMAIYRVIGHMLTHGVLSLALQQADNGGYRIGNDSFHVVPLGDLPSGHRYTNGYKRTDPAIRWYYFLFPSFSSFLFNGLLWRWCYEHGVDAKIVVYADIGRDDPRYGRLLTEGITEDLGIAAVDYRYDQVNLPYGNASHECRVIVSGFRPNETVAAFLWVGFGRICLYTTERFAADAPASLTQRFPESIGAVRRVLRPFGLERDVIDRGTVVPGLSD
ncbi:unnamed protein product [Vitrella brassicaformis CCMP3155]|uniref:Uncharacterized protein n=1 Tax=Vitrella brassicaformis (strain CCMP3155) TaxID=1169540 RepID=A0A0G4FCN7_VITBC|nr:unnamed protein product [Vitrella brassicaformis CCMP3155]|eukprot:CEM10923.1 unnamed protein product [Vitrella brassicaformis CCMP3155]